MKRIMVFLLILTLMLTSVVFVSAKSDEYADLTQNGSDITVTYNVSTENARNLIVQVLEEMMKSYSYEELSTNPTSMWITKDIAVFIRFNYKDAFSVISADENTGIAELSLYDDILPSFPEGTDFSEGGEITCTLVTANENYPEETSRRFAESVCPAKIIISPTGTATYIIKDGATNPNPVYFGLPLTNDIILEQASLFGHTFAGWEKDGKAINKIPAGTKNITVTCNLTPKTFAVNYVLTTDITFSFGRADNTANPTRYTYGETTPLYKLKSPVGGYSFYGWYLNGNKITEIPDNITGDIILYAKWITDEEKESVDKDEKIAKIHSEYFCDLDSDMKITAADARLVLRMCVGLENFPTEIRKRADLYGSGIISAENARTILRLAVGLEDLITVYDNSRLFELN